MSYKIESMNESLDIECMHNLDLWKEITLTCEEVRTLYLKYETHC